jgi:hypothetical protein
VAIATNGAYTVFPRGRLLDAGVLLAIAVASFAALQSPIREYVFQQHFAAEYFEVLPRTIWAALTVWTFWAASAAVLMTVALRVAPALGLLDGAIAGLIGVWLFAYLGANILGPIGLFRSWTIWALLAAGLVWLRRVGLPPLRPRPRPSTGQWLALLAFALLFPGMLLLQLGSPLPPYMDILATPASAQRILTFGWYLPFDNDPYGYWDAASQCPGTELLYALLGLGSGAKLATLAETAAMLPMTALFILGMYRLGRTIGGDIMGGLAALLLFATIFFRVMPYMHGREVTFVLVGVGLAFVLDEQRMATRLVVGALALGTAVAGHAIIGGFGMVTAALSMVLWFFAGDVVAMVLGAVLLFGASLVAAPTIAVGLRLPLPYPLLPLLQLLGVGLTVVAARGLDGRPMRDLFPARILRWAMTLAAIYILWMHPAKLGVVNDQWSRFPLLSVGALVGFAAMLWYDVRRRFQVQLGPVVAAFLFGVGLDYVSREWWTTFTVPTVQTAVEDFYHKVDYWNPYVLVLPTACAFMWIYKTVSPRLAVYALLALLFFPWKDGSAHPDPNYHQHSIAESYAYSLQISKNGYWGATGHRRWGQSAAELEIADILRGEIAAGRVTLATHVVHLTPHVILYQDNVLFSVYAGVNDDGYVERYEFDRSIAGGRLRPIADLPKALAQKPPYIVVHESTANAEKLSESQKLSPEVLHEYDELLNRDGVRLLRLRSLAPATVQVAE